MCVSSFKRAICLCLGEMVLYFLTPSITWGVLLAGHLTSSFPKTGKGKSASSNGQQALGAFDKPSSHISVCSCCSHQTSIPNSDHFIFSSPWFFISVKWAHSQAHHFITCHLVYTEPTVSLRLPRRNKNTNFSICSIV